MAFNLERFILWFCPFVDAFSPSSPNTHCHLVFTPAGCSCVIYSLAVCSEVRGRRFPQTYLLLCEKPQPFLFFWNLTCLAVRRSGLIFYSQWMNVIATSQWGDWCSLLMVEMGTFNIYWRNRSFICQHCTSASIKHTVSHLFFLLHAYLIGCEQFITFHQWQYRVCSTAVTRLL